MTGRLDALLGNPAAVAEVPVAEVPALLAALAAEQARLAALEGLFAARLADASRQRRDGRAASASRQPTRTA